LMRKKMDFLEWVAQSFEFENSRVVVEWRWNDMLNAKTHRSTTLDLTSARRSQPQPYYNS
jgi:hypothetical protein